MSGQPYSARQAALSMTAGERPQGCRRSAESLNNKATWQATNAECLQPCLAQYPLTLLLEVAQLSIGTQATRAALRSFEWVAVRLSRPPWKRAK